MHVTIRDATSADSDFLAWVQIEASRSGRPIGFWDLALPGADQPRTSLIAQVIRSRRESFSHYRGFLVAEVDGVPVGALSGYEPRRTKLGHFVGALSEVLTENGWSETHQNLVAVRIAPFAACTSETPEDCWIVEWVALTPEARGKGVASMLLEAILARGRSAGYAKAQISVLIGNTPAQRCYERGGFSFVDDKRTPEFEALVGSPGVARMLREL